MIEPESLDRLSEAMKVCVASDAHLLDEMRGEVRPLRTQIRRIQARSATAISLVGTDGGNNQLRFDPFLVQLIRVVDSSQNEYCLEVITPNTPFDALNLRHFEPDGRGKTPLGRMAQFLGLKDLTGLSPVFKSKDRSPSWVNVYREMTEWAVLFSLIREKEFGTDTVIVCDGFLRSKMFSADLFGKLREGMEECILRQYERTKRRVYVAGIAKHSSVLQVYRMALALEGVMKTSYACYLEVPKEMEQRAYKWDLAQFRVGVVATAMPWFGAVQRTAWWICMRSCQRVPSARERMASMRRGTSSAPRTDMRSSGSVSDP